MNASVWDKPLASSTFRRLISEHTSEMVLSSGKTKYLNEKTKDSEFLYSYLFIYILISHLFIYFSFLLFSDLFPQNSEPITLLKKLKELADTNKRKYSTNTPITGHVVSLDVPS